MLIKDFLIGGDHEVFLKDKNTNEIVSAEGIIKGTKHDPFNFDETDRFACTSLDNVLAEYNIKPSKTKAEYYHAIQKALDYIKNFIPKNLEPIAIPAARLDSKYLQTENALLFGCERDYNAWTNQINDSPQAEDSSLRSAGFHITLGYDNPNEIVNLMWVKAMDLYVGVPSVIQEPDNERKKLYGKAGAFRHTPFGSEYRSTSNYILQNKNLINWAFDSTVKAVEFVNNDRIFELDEESDSIISAINDKDSDKAKYLIDKFKLELAA